MVDAVFVCVNYNNYNDTLNYVNHLKEVLSNYLYDVIIVDNSEGDNNYSIIKDNCVNKKNIYIVNSNRNLGYFSAMQKGIDYYLNIKNQLPNIVVVGNTDITIKNKNFIDLINKNIEENILAIAPNILLSDMFVKQNPFKESNTSIKKLKFLKLIYSNSIFTYLYNLLYNFFKKDINFIKNNKEEVESKTIYAAHGSYIILLKEFFDRNGTLEYKGFLYGEEIFLAEQILRLKGKIKYCSDINIIHNENSVTKLIESRQKRLYKLNSTKYLIEYIKKNLENIKKEV